MFGFDDAQTYQLLPPEPDVMLGDGATGVEDHHLHSPSGCAFVPAKPDLIVVTLYGANQVRVHHLRTGAMLCKLGRDGGLSGDEDGEFKGPLGVAVTANSNFVVVSDQENNRLQVLQLTISEDCSTASLVFIRFIGQGQLSYPYGITLRQAVLNDRVVETVVVADSANSCIQEFKINGTFVRRFGSAGDMVHEVHKGVQDADGHLGNPSGVAVLPSGAVAVADSGNHRIQVFDENGTVILKFGCYGDGDGEFQQPMTITADGNGHLLVTDFETNRLQVFTLKGAHLCTRTDVGLAPGTSQDVKSDSEGRLLVAATQSHQVLFWEAPSDDAADDAADEVVAEAVSAEAGGSDGEGGAGAEDAEEAPVI
jgi:DNA-binding beta-propeller fold protein YncE